MYCGVVFRYVDGGGGCGMDWPHGGGGGAVWLVCCDSSWSVVGGCGVYILALFGGVMLRLLRYWFLFFVLGDGGGFLSVTQFI